jgi:hypothetical protein
MPTVTDGAGADHDPVPPIRDDKDWTWVLDRRCPECGFDAAMVARSTIAGRLRASTPRWQAALLGPDVTQRPAPGIWSVLEYACHVRDVHTIFGARARLIQERPDPLFDNWDQDVTALEKRYWEADPADVSVEVEVQAQAAARAFDDLDDDRWTRAGRRSNGSVFTMETLGRYYLHDVEHHLHDIAR